MTEKYSVLATNVTNNFVVNIQKKKKHANVLNPSVRLSLLNSLLVLFTSKNSQFV